MTDIVNNINDPKKVDSTLLSRISECKAIKRLDNNKLYMLYFPNRGTSMVVYLLCLCQEQVVHGNPFRLGKRHVTRPIIRTLLSRLDLSCVLTSVVFNKVVCKNHLRGLFVYEQIVDLYEAFPTVEVAL